MTDFLTVLVFVGLAIVLIGRTQRRQRRARLKTQAPSTIYRTPPPAIDPSLDPQPTSAATEAGYLRSAATAQVADVLSQVLGAEKGAPMAEVRSEPDPSWNPPEWSSDGTGTDHHPPEAAEPADDAADLPVEPAPSNLTSTPPEPLFADLDPDRTEPAVTAALQNPDIRAAERALRNASLNGVEGADIALGRLMHRAGRDDEAEGVFRNAARTDGIAANNLAVVLEHDGRVREAQTFYRKAAELGNQIARQNLERLEG